MYVLFVAGETLWWDTMVTTNRISNLDLLIVGMSVWRSDIKCKYMCMFLLKNLACKELKTLNMSQFQVKLTESEPNQNTTKHEPWP